MDGTRILCLPQCNTDGTTNDITISPTNETIITINNAIKALSLLKSGAVSAKASPIPKR